jgi:hypothetical protein
LILAAVLSVLGGASVPILQAALSEDPPKLTRPCIEIAASYVEELKKSPEMRELILPGDDGMSIINSDPEARLCGINPSVLERITK